MDSADSHTAYSLPQEVSGPAVDAGIRGALLAVRPRLDSLSIDLVSDEPWPETIAEALTTLEQHRRRPWLLRYRKPITADIDPSDDGQFDAALQVVPYTICATGITTDGRAGYNANDTGTSTWFELSGAEIEVARNYMAARGHDPDLLAPAPRR